MERRTARCAGAAVFACEARLTNRLPATSRKQPRFRVLIVDDSAVIRSVLQSSIVRHPLLEVVGTACDGEEALRQIVALQPDVVTLDIEMPHLSGLGVLERLAGKAPANFVMISTLTQAGAQATFEALQRGAFDYVPKPTPGGGFNLQEFQGVLHEKLIAAARAKGRLRRVVAPAPAARVAQPAAPLLPRNAARGWLVGIGISCGGPPTLAQLLPAFPSDFVPILVTQHMPPQFTSTLAAQLDRACPMHVVEAKQGMPVRQGMILIAPGDAHLRLCRNGAELQVRLDYGPRVSGHRPSVDVMFASMAEACGARAIGVVMTGMGCDGTDGVRRLNTAGAWTIAQDQDSSLVFGMPKAAAATGLIDLVAAAADVPETLAALLRKGEKRRD